MIHVSRFTHHVSRMLRRLIFALSMLTRIPMPFLRDLTPKEMGQSSIFFPLVGAGVGAWLIGIHWLCRHLWDDALLIAICTLMGWIGVTGGFHLDGLMDTCDGIFSGKGRAEMLRIMKDSHVGAFGVIGLVCTLLLKSGGLHAMEAEEAWKGLLVAPIMGRWSMTYATAVFRYAREEVGLGAAFAKFSDWKCLLLASIFTVAVVLGVFRQEAFVLIPPVVAFICFTAWRLARQLGGLTGDTYGALCELTEGFCLLLFSVRWT
jgi:adenosylcobinamide-GDP ribazoletransferase